jgi:anti-sigma B factor antagonist
MEIFRVRAVPGETTCTLYLSGEADLAVADDIIDLGTVGLDEPTTLTLIIDFAGCTFIDSSALGAMVHLRNIAVAADKSLILTKVSDRIHRLLELTGLDTVFDVSPTDGDPTPATAG